MRHACCQNGDGAPGLIWVRRCIGVVPPPSVVVPQAPHHILQLQRAPRRQEGGQQAARRRLLVAAQQLLQAAHARDCSQYNQAGEWGGVGVRVGQPCIALGRWRGVARAGVPLFPLHCPWQPALRLPPARPAHGPGNRLPAAGSARTVEVDVDGAALCVVFEEVEGLAAGGVIQAFLHSMLHQAWRGQHGCRVAQVHLLHCGGASGGSGDGGRGKDSGTVWC